MTSLTAKYQPSTLQGFVGLDEPKAVLAAVAREPYSSAFMFLGNPGTGKTTAGLAFAKSINAEVHHIPSRMCDLETVDRTVAGCWYRSMFGTYHVVLVDEADQMTKPAQLAFLSKLDATAFPPDTIFVFTANATEKLEDRFLSRCRVLEFTPPADSEMVSFLRKVWQAETRAPEPDLAAIAAKAKGNVRSALNALELKLLVAQEPAETPKRTWFDTVSAATPSAKRMKRILVKNESTGQWDRVMVEVPA